MQNMFVIMLDSVISTDCRGYSHLAEIYGRVFSQGNKDVLISFDRCYQFDSNMAAVLGSVITDLRLRGYNIIINYPLNVKVRRNLSRCKFLKAFDTVSFSMEKENYLEYKMFSPKEGDSFKEYIESQLMHKQKFPAHSDKAGELIQESILEIFVNAVDHGKSEYIFSCGEYFGSAEPPFLNMTIVDRGNTILRTVNDFLEKKSNKQRLDPWEAIIWAMEKGHTTKSYPGGLGLSRLKSFMDVNQGELHIVSDSAMVQYIKGDSSRFKLLAPFEGTIVTMKFNFDDNQNYYIAKEEVYDYNNLL